MRTIDPRGYGELTESDRDSVNAWLDFHGIDYKEVRLVTFNDDGTAMVSRWDTDWRGRMPRISREGEVPFYATNLVTKPQIGDHDG